MGPRLSPSLHAMKHVYGPRRGRGWRGSNCQPSNFMSTLTTSFESTNFCFFQRRVHSLVEDGHRPDELRQILASRSPEERIRILTTPSTDDKDQVGFISAPSLVHTSHFFYCWPFPASFRIYFSFFGTLLAYN